MRTETCSTPGPLLLNLEIPAGEIEIETSNTDETQIELEAIAKNDAVRDLVDNSRIELVKRANGHEVVVEAKSRQGIFISLSRGPDIRVGGRFSRLFSANFPGVELPGARRRLRAGQGVHGWSLGG